MYIIYPIILTLSLPSPAVFSPPAGFNPLIVRFKLFNEARIDEKENKSPSTDWTGLY
jgi:hypothetical protein